MSSWDLIGTVNAARLEAARLEAHWGAQLIAATADAVLPAAEDDSHTNMRWDRTLRALVGQPLPGGIRIGLKISPLSVLVIGARGVEDERPLTGATLAAAEDWLSGVAGRAADRGPVQVRHRDYDLPPHPLADGHHFNCRDGEALLELAHWFGNGTELLGEVALSHERSSPIAVWPHHFDAGGILFLEAGADAARGRQVGYGLSPGDHHLTEPYFYVTAWPLPSGARLDGLPSGHWFSGGFQGAVLAATEVAVAGDVIAQRAKAASFLRAAIARGEALLS